MINKQNYFLFLVFETIHKMMTTTRPTRKKAHHIPALKIVSIAPQPLNTKSVKNSTKRKGANFI